MGTGGQVVHLGSGCSSAQSSLLHQTVDLVGRADSPLTQAFHEDSFLLVLSDLQTGPVYLQQVTDHLIVDLKITGSHHECSVLRTLHLNESEYLLH